MENDHLIREFHRTNVIIWSAVLITVIVLGVVVFIIDGMMVFQAVDGAAQINQIIFILAVVIAFAILFLKRSFFIPDKIVSNLPQKTDAEKINLCLARIRKNYLIVWALGESIGVL